jgi:rare lipoprotein A
MGLALAGLVALSVQSEALPPVPQDTKTAEMEQPTPEVGVASWYGEECSGNPTASGEIYDWNGLTAAHRQLPLGTWIKVTNLRNNRWLILRVNDRGPGIPGRLLDVTMEAARRLGFKGMGLTQVQIEVVSYPKRYAASQAGRSATQSAPALALRTTACPGCLPPPLLSTASYPQY